MPSWASSPYAPIFFTTIGPENLQVCVLGFPLQDMWLKQTNNKCKPKIVGNRWKSRFGKGRSHWIATSWWRNKRPSFVWQGQNYSLNPGLLVRDWNDKTGSGLMLDLWLQITTYTRTFYMIFKSQKMLQNVGSQKEKLWPGGSHLFQPICTKVQRCPIFYFYLNSTS